MYVNNQSILDAAEDADLYWHYMKAEKKLLEEQRAELRARLSRRNKALAALRSEGESYTSYAERATNYLSAHNAVKSAEAVIESTTTRLFKYSAKFSA